FLPATGTLDLYREAATGPGRRVDSGVAEGDSISLFYDPMLGKLIAWGENREEARLRLLAMLDETCVGGVRTNLTFLRRVIGHPAFAAAELDTGFIPRHEADLMRTPGELPDAFWQLAAKLFVETEPTHIRNDDVHSPWAKRAGLRLGMPALICVHLSCNGECRTVRVTDDAALRRSELARECSVDGPRSVGFASKLAPTEGRRSPKAIRQGRTLYLEWNGELQAITVFDPIAAAEASHQQHGGLSAPMNGSIVRVLVEAGQSVEAGSVLIVMEAMKMEHSIRAAQAGVVKSLLCSEGEMVGEGTVLLEMEQA
uniref:biotin/lipoyl-containing protein n=1 Tax=Stutzerimonas nitrititolerans TaxID=2482751 RepID=UPI0028A736E1